MNKQLISIAIASTLLTATAHNAYAGDSQISDNKHKQYIGTGIGATAGALVAGPVGLIVGGLIGNLAGKHDAMDDTVPVQSSVTIEPHTETALHQASVSTEESETVETVVVAQAGEIESVIDDDSVDHSSALKDILVKEMSLDVFFLSGSTTVETFYKPRLQAVSNFMQQLPGIDIHLDGYSDRRGDKDTNLALSNQRLNAVRDELVQAGIDANRIHINAYGEQQFVSRPGDLEAYSFDRRVVIRFQHSTAVTENPLAFIENGTLL